jgi:glutamine amidotransferase
MIGIVDYDMGNIGSIVNMIEYLQGSCTLVSDAAAMQVCDKLILPGVGAFDTAMKQLRKRDLLSPLHSFAMEKRKPVLGVCLGMQLMCAGSEEGLLQGLGWFDTVVTKFQFTDKKLRVPHMGWNHIRFVQPGFSLFKNLSEEDNRFYFVHSYAVQNIDDPYVAGITHYGVDFASVLAKYHLMGFQCHPEKSHRFGMQVYKNFINL